MSSSGDGGHFKPNKNRGFWSSRHDFVWACLNDAFRIDNIYEIAIVPMIVTYGFFPVLWWFLNALLYAAPIFFIHSYLGQFSSSGYISALRIMPLFKGLGYFGLAMSFVSLAFHSVMIAAPLLFFVHSLQPTLPWSCDADHPWTLFADKDNEYLNHVAHCNFTYSEEPDDYTIMFVPSVEFYRHKLSDFNLEVILILLVVWAAVAFTVYQGPKKIGIFLRYSTIVMVSLLPIIFVRMLFLPGVYHNLGMSRFFHAHETPLTWALMPAFLVFMTIGPGWGSVVSLASYNKFKTNIMRYSWVIPVCQLVVLALLTTLSDLAEVSLSKNHRHIASTSQVLSCLSSLSIPSVLASVELPHLWNWMFLIMVILGSFNLMVTQLFSIQTALLDEFERLRPFRKELILASVVLLAVLSTPFSTIRGQNLIGTVFTANAFSQCLINLLLILGLLWVYGQKRLRRDVEFMTEKVLATWKVYYIRFVTPVLFVLILLVGLFFGNYNFVNKDLGVACFAMLFAPWIILPGYFVYKMWTGKGGCKSRLSQCSEASDWHPVDAADKQRYAEVVGFREASVAFTDVMHADTECA